MPWFTPAFQQAPPPPPKPAIIYHTAVPTPPLPKRVTVRKPVEAAQAVPAGMTVPMTLRKVIYLDQRRQGTVRSALRMIAIQTGWAFVDHAHGPAVRIPSSSDVVYISGNPNNAPAIDDLLAIGRIVVRRGLTIQANPNSKTITLMKAAG